MSSTVRLLDIFQSKARCRYPTAQRKARTQFAQLSVRLPEIEVTKLKVAWDHVITGEGPSEFGHIPHPIRRDLTGA